jgi:hypothetical protein
MPRWLAVSIARLPRWLQPPATGAIAGAAMMLVISLTRLPEIIREPRQGLWALIALAVVSAAGACGGLMYSLVGRPLRRIPRVGRYLAGIACVAGYLFPLALLFSHFADSGDDTFNLSDPVSLVVLLFCTVFFGLVMGHTWFRRPPVSS